MRVQHKGWFFYYASDPKPPPRSFGYQLIGKPVVRKNLATGEEKLFESIRESVVDGISEATIASRVNGRYRQQPSDSYSWRRATAQDLYIYS